MAGNETIELKISLGGVSLLLEGTVDRLDKTSDGGILAMFFRTDDGPLPDAARLRRDHALTIYHLLTAATYPLKRPVRLQEWWLALDQGVTVELSEEEYRRNLSDLREPVQALAAARCGRGPVCIARRVLLNITAARLRAPRGPNRRRGHDAPSN